MQQVKFEGELVTANPESPHVARCPACVQEVRKREWRRDGGETIWFYRHRIGVGDGCPPRYRAMEWAVARSTVSVE
jgi:hypothetical protein